MSKRIQGIFPALVTPLGHDSAFAPEVFSKLLARVYDAGCDGVYISGSTGEGMLLSAATRQAITEAAVAGSPAGKQVIVHVGARVRDEAFALARHAAKAGAHAVSSLPPSGLAFADLKRYYAALADASGLPLFVYHFPERCPEMKTPEQVLELVSMPEAAGIKFTDYDLFTLSRAAETGKTVFNGRDEVLAAGLLMGASGGIGSFYNLAPSWFVNLFRAAQRKEWDAARTVQVRINKLIEITIQYPLIPAIKDLLATQGIDSGPAAGAPAFLSGDQRAALHAQLAEAGMMEFA